ncbi:MAG: AAA family ATPase [Acidobacteria bacterium]|nr:AAA family ATPase [Acidobacteriota bacterium]
MRNFKRFYGKHLLDLAPDASGEKPLILIGGDNGSGKTSIHEAINYALYEDDDLPGITTRPNYLRAVQDRLNRRALDEGQQDFAVVLELLVTSGDDERCFRIERKWDVSGRHNVTPSLQIRPCLTVCENGRPLDWIDADNPTALQDFLRNILPPRIAPFFIFDGERIQDFADESGHEQRMVDAIEDILHINVYKMLREDLKKQVVDYLERSEVAPAETGDFFTLQQEAERIEGDLEAKRDRLAEIAREIDEQHRARKRAEEELRRIASPHASQRDELILEQQRLEQELESVKTDIQKAFEPLPVMLAGALCNDLRETLRREGLSISTPDGLEQLRAKVVLVEEGVFVVPNPKPPSSVAMSKAQTGFYRKRFRRVAEDVFELSAGGSMQRLHDVGEGERQNILARLDFVAQRAASIREAIDRRERIAGELRDIQNKLQTTSDDPRVKEVIRQKQDTDENIGRLEEESHAVEAGIQQLEADSASRQRQIEDRQRTRQATTEAKRVIKLAQEARLTLDTFIKRLAPEKLASLKTHFEDMYRRLRRPEDPVFGIDIDSETWQVILKDKKGRPLEKRVFSAGMKELYALSLLWALARASGRELPIVIDTPAGRLDTTNRRALFEKYLPYAGHQVIVLSTDTEVDVQWAKRLSPSVSKQYRLDYDAKEGSTVIRLGYFF